MPKPIYLICCQFAQIDQETNLVSHFNVLELANIHKKSKADDETARSNLNICVVSVWMKGPEDEGQEFSLVFSMTDTRGCDHELAQVIFKFTDKPFRRTVLKIQGPSMLGDQSGTAWIRARLREAGSNEDLAIQEYPLAVVVHEAEEVENS